MSRVEKEIAEEVGKSDLETANNLGYVEILPESRFVPADNHYGHYDTFPKMLSIAAVTTMLATESGNSPFQPSFMSWS